MNTLLTREDAVLEGNLTVKNNRENKVSEVISIYTRELENADNVLKSRIENELVNIGSAAVPAASIK